MTLRKMPEIEAFNAPVGYDWDSPIDARDAWRPVRALAADDSRTLNIFSEVGDRGNGEGVTLAYVRGALKRMGSGDVTVNLNSPGGDFFSGIAIYNALREHAGKITANVLGVAASAASVIAMAGDQINIGKSAFVMIHNASAIAMGNRHDMAQVVDMLGKFDAAMASVYAARSGIDAKKIAAMMDTETFFTGEEAVKAGMADALLPSDAVAPADEPTGATALRRLDIALAHAGLPRSERRDLLSQYLNGTPRAAVVPDTPRAVDTEVAATLRRLSTSLKP